MWQQLEVAAEIVSDLQDTGLGPEVAYLFQCWKTSTCFIWMVYNSGAVNVKIDWYVFVEKCTFEMLGFSFSSKLDWGSYIISIAETASKKIGALVFSINFLSSEVPLYVYIFAIQPCMEYCWYTGLYLEMLSNQQKWICRAVGPSLATSLQPMVHHQNLVSLRLAYRYYFGRCSSEIAQLVPFPYSWGRSTHYSYR